MKQWITKQDGLENLQLVDVSPPSQLKDGEVLVKVNSVSLNYRDTEGLSTAIITTIIITHTNTTTTESRSCTRSILTMDRSRSVHGSLRPLQQYTAG
jgi:hypothetical protein